jgi:hypothetical protein
MKNRIGIAALSIFLLASCAQQMGGPEAFKQCVKPKDTKITVQNVVPVVDQDPIYVCARNVKLTWYLDPNQTSLYEFKSNSIVIHSNDGEFGGCTLDDKTRITCHDNNNQQGQGNARDYKYDIKVYALGSAPNAAPVAKRDPSIMND